MNKFEKVLLISFFVLALLVGIIVLSPIAIPILLVIVILGLPIWLIKLDHKLVIKKYERKKKKKFVDINTDRKKKK